jgi:23S rRNA (adenine2503-C2)-methyltransferase
MPNSKTSIYDLDYIQLREAMLATGQPAYRADQIWDGLYRQLWHTPDEFTNLPLKLRRLIADTYAFTKLAPGITLNSSDLQTRKTLFTLPDENAIETVLMRYARRRTLCISTQAGCAMGCVFCATGQMGFRRNLTSGEIVEQVLYFARLLASEGEQVTHIVLMGMGEPFHNYEATMAAIERLNHPKGFNLGQRRFTISTVGLVPMIQKFAQENRRINLAVSLHAAEDDLRASMLPINRKYPLKMLIQACKDYVAATHRRITFEWALIQGVNDTPDQAQKLVKLLDGLLCHVNVIPLNPTRGYEGQATTQTRARQFQSMLETAGIPCTIRLRRGIDIQAGCGQLAIQNVG